MPKIDHPRKLARHPAQPLIRMLQKVSANAAQVVRHGM